MLISCFINGNSTDDLYDYYVILNGNSYSIKDHDLPTGVWEILADHELASCHVLNITSGSVNIHAQSGILLRKLRH